MKYKIASYQNLFATTQNQGNMITNEDNIQISTYHVKKGASLNISFSDDDLSHNIVVIYIVLSGQIEVCEAASSKIVNANEMIILHPQNNFLIVVKEEANLICINNEGGGDIDQKHVELHKILKEAEENDTYVIGHNYRVSRYSLMIMQMIDPNHDDKSLRFAAGFHDIGKAKLDPAILNKPGKLTAEEFEHIKKHPAYSYEILKEHLGEKVANIAKCHHEKLDGSGYPNGLKAKDIPIESQIIAVADIFDALTTSRSYRDAYSFDQALAIMEEDVINNKINKDVYNALKTLIARKTIEEGKDNILRKQKDDQ